MHRTGSHARGGGRGVRARARSGCAAARRAHRALALGALALTLAPQAHAAATKPSLLRVVGGVVTRDATPLFRGAQPAWSPDGSQIAFVRDGSVWTANADGSGQRPIGPGSDPAWTPKGVLSYARNGRIVAGTSTLAAGAHPAFSRDGALAYDAGGIVYVGKSELVAGADPAWSPDATAIVFVRDGELWAIGADGTSEAQLTSGLGDVHDPAWSPDRKQILFVSGGQIRTFAVATGVLGVLAKGEAPDWKSVPTARMLLPDLDQQAPANVYVARHGSRRVLAFRSAVANLGRGPLMIVGDRRKGQPTMVATQLVRLSDGSRRRLSSAGFLRYNTSPTHSHWHFHPFERYELWRVGGTHAVARDHKQGFCFGDRHPLRGAGPPAFVAGDCGLYKPWLLSVFEGTSTRYVDIYPPEFHGQWIDITGIPDGVYDLVHRTNPDFALRERDYANDAASVRIRLRALSVGVLKRCPGRGEC
jgi:Lysyl oxidase/WD40-like Beta Propeller Repeat